VPRFTNVMGSLQTTTVDVHLFHMNLKRELLVALLYRRVQHTTKRKNFCPQLIAKRSAYSKPANLELFESTSGIVKSFAHRSLYKPPDFYHNLCAIKAAFDILQQLPSFGVKNYWFAAGS
jgi:hypothetical protein